MKCVCELPEHNKIPLFIIYIHSFLYIYIYIFIRDHFLLGVLEFTKII